MRIDFNALFLASLPLCAPLLGYEARYETRQPEKTNVNYFQQSNSRSKEIQFISHSVLWNVDRRLGTIQTLTPDAFSPLWSSSGVVYRASQNSFSIASEEKISNVAPDRPMFGEFVEFTEISERVYFHLSEKNNLSFLPSSRDYEDQILAFDPNAQGKLLWRLKAYELAKILRVSSNAVPRFAATPLQGKDDVLIVLLVLDSQIISVNVDARFGMPLVD